MNRDVIADIETGIGARMWPNTDTAFGQQVYN